MTDLRPFNSFHHRFPELTLGAIAYRRIAAGSRQIEATDRDIDRLVYQLYGLTDAEIAIVEEATA